MKKIFFCLFCLFVFLSSNNVFAVSYESISVGTNYKGKWIWDTGIDSSGAATISANNFKKFGYSGYLNTTPNAQFFQGKTITSENYILETPIIHLAGHGKPSGMNFKYYNSKDYETSVVIGNTRVVDGVTLVGLSNYDLTKVRLFIFQGCNTASGSNNIAETANRLGAKVTLGWYDVITTASNEQWISRFSSKLGEANATVSEAVSYANSFTYADSNVKKVNVYGNSNLRLSAGGGLPLPFSSNEFFSDDDRKIYYPHNIIFSDDSGLSELSDYIENNINPDYQIDDYRLIKISDSLYDLSYVINDNIRTDMGYVIEIVDGYVSKIYDNMKSVDALAISSLANLYHANSFDYESSHENISDDFIVDNVEEFDFYDSEEKKVKRIARITVRNVKNDTMSAYDKVLY